MVNSKIEQIKIYINRGPVGHPSIEEEYAFIRSQQELTTEVHSCGYIDDIQFQVEMMTLSARFNILECFQKEMFNRYNDMFKGE